MPEPKESKEQQVYRILLTPIQVTKHSGFNDNRKISIKNENGIIKTTQTYWPEYVDKEKKIIRYPFPPDCDMSDFACGFYEIIYATLLNGKTIVNSSNCGFNNKCYAGDTMTSVSLLPGLKDKYHCLANFWILPIELGRKFNCELSKTSNCYNIQDFMDRFLLLLKYKFEDYKNTFPKYFDNIKTFKDISKIHMLFSSYLDEKIMFCNIVI